MTIIDYTNAFQSQFEDLIIDYFAELGDIAPADVLREKLLPFIRRQLDSEIIRISLITDERGPMGFSVYQIDQETSDWCKRPGWGFIREFYIAPPYRKLGYGARLAAGTERRLREMGAVQLYLTSGSGAAFWQKCGWRLTEEICSNDLNILEK